MKLHYMGKYDMDPEKLPHGEHMPGAVKFKEAASVREMGIIANGIALAVFAVMVFFAALRAGDMIYREYVQLLAGFIASLAAMFPHEFLHAVCFKEDAYLYTNLAQGMLFVVGPERMSKGRFVFMSLLPNIVFGFAPYAIGMVFPKCVFLLAMGTMAASMGGGDYYNVYNAMTQMPKGARTYLYKFNSYWYMP